MTVTNNLKKQINNLNQAAQELGIKSKINLTASDTLSNQLEQLLTQFENTSKNVSDKYSLSGNTANALVVDIARSSLKQNGRKVQVRSLAVSQKPSGFLSRIIKQVEEELNRISRIANLPTPVVSIKKNATKLLKDVLTKTKISRQKGLKFASPSITVLNDVLADFGNPAVSNQNILERVKGVEQNATALVAEFNKINAQRTTTQLGKLITSSNAVKAKIQKQIAALKADIQYNEKRKKDAEAKKRKLGFLRFFIPLASIILRKKVNNELKALNSRLKHSRNTLVKAKVFGESTKQISSKFDSLLGQMMSTKNGIDFIIGDLKIIIENLEQSKNQMMAKLFIITTLSNIKSLLKDLS